MTAPRTAIVERATSETRITAELRLDAAGTANVSTGLGFFDHMLTALAKHARFDLTLTCAGDLHIDDHHTIEDCALALGAALDQALGDRAGIERFAHAYAPLDESLVRVVIDFSGRPFAHCELDFSRDAIGPVATENLTHFFRSLASAARCTLHLDLIRGDNDHHKAEAAFKALAIALRTATRTVPGDAGIPSTKGTLT
ncbi:MAG: imidazoleglycerol-phosphate dehydratase HisB [Planctomycetota bacterium]